MLILMGPQRRVAFCVGCWPLAQRWKSGPKRRSENGARQRIRKEEREQGIDSPMIP